MASLVFVSSWSPLNCSFEKYSSNSTTCGIVERNGTLGQDWNPIVPGENSSSDRSFNADIFS